MIFAEFAEVRKKTQEAEIISQDLKINTVNAVRNFLIKLKQIYIKSKAKAK